VVRDYVVGVVAPGEVVPVDGRIADDMAVLQAALQALTQVHTVLIDHILPHEQAEEARLYPALAGPLGSAVRDKRRLTP
jgi:hypothetical protein